MCEYFVQVELLRNCIGRTRVKTSVALDGLVSFGETYHEYDPILTGAQPSNPWVSDDATFWTFNCPMYVLKLICYHKRDNK